MYIKVGGFVNWERSVRCNTVIQNISRFDRFCLRIIGDLHKTLRFYIVVYRYCSLVNIVWKIFNFDERINNVSLFCILETSSIYAITRSRPGRRIHSIRPWLHEAISFVLSFSRFLRILLNNILTTGRNSVLLSCISGTEYYFNKERHRNQYHIQIGCELHFVLRTHVLKAEGDQD